MIDIDEECPSPRGALDTFVASVSTPILRLDANAVDLPASAATCDPTPLLGDALRDTLSQPNTIVPQHPVGHDVHRVPRGAKAEYVRLTARELQLGKLVLRPTALGLGTIFPVP